LSKYDWLLFFHVTGAFLLIGGSVAAAVFTIMSRLRTRPSEIAALLGLVQLVLPFIYAGVLLAFAFGLWLVRTVEPPYSFGAAWIVAALVLLVLANALVALGGIRESRTAELAARIASEGDEPTTELRRRLRDPLSLAYNFGSGLVVLAILGLMIWKPGS